MLFRSDGELGSLVGLLPESGVFARHGGELADLDGFLGAGGGGGAGKSEQDGKEAGVHGGEELGWDLSRSGASQGDAGGVFKAEDWAGKVFPKNRRNPIGFCQGPRGRFDRPG